MRDISAGLAIWCAIGLFAASSPALAGPFAPVSVSGVVYNDLNGNGVPDPGEPGLAGSTVDLLNSANTIISSTTSDANGDYSFSISSSGSFTLEEIVPGGFFQTQPGPPGTYSFTTTSGINILGEDFGDEQGTAPSPVPEPSAAALLLSALTSLLLCLRLRST
jgi:SdrD B-like domain